MSLTPQQRGLPGSRLAALHWVGVRAELEPRRLSPGPGFLQGTATV